MKQIEASGNQFWMKFHSTILKLIKLMGTILLKTMKIILLYKIWQFGQPRYLNPNVVIHVNTRRPIHVLCIYMCVDTGIHQLRNRIIIFYEDKAGNPKKILV